MYLFKKEEFNYLKLTFHLPEVALFLFKFDRYYAGIKLDTNIWWSLDDCAWEFNFLVLGFGIKLIRQWSY